MSKTLTLGIVISALGFGGAVAALGSVNERIGSIGRTIDKLKTQQETALGRMDQAWIGGTVALKKYAAEVGKLDQKIAALGQRKIQLEMLGAQHTANRADMNSRMGDVAMAYGLGKTMQVPIAAFVTQEDALNNLRVAMMKAGGVIGPDFDKIKRQAVELGNVLPGTTADYVNVATAMLELGTAQEKIAGGAFEAAANLKVVLRLGGYEAGELVAKVRHAYNLTDEETAKMADKMQRAKYAFGLKPMDLRVAASYEAAQLNILGLGGEKNMEKMMVLQGVANLKGMEASTFGTSFSMMLARLAKGPLMMEQARKGMKKEAAEIMHAMNLKFDFFDKNGMFVGLEGMIKELEKLKLIKAKLGDKAALEVNEAVFGTEAGRPAALLAEMGADGFKKAMASYREQASLQERITQTLTSTRNTWEALTGSIENFMAAGAGPAVESLKPLIRWLNDAAGAMTTFAESHPTAARWLGQIALFATSATVAFLSLGVAMSVARFAATGFMLIPGVAMLGRGIAGIAATLRGPLTGGLGVARTAAMFLGRAMLIPFIGLTAAGAVGAAKVVVIAAAIAGVGYLIYRNWQPVKGFFGGLWQGISQGAGPALSAIRPALGALWGGFKSLWAVTTPMGWAFRAAFSVLRPLLGSAISWVGGLWARFTGMSAPIKSSGDAARSWGLSIGKSIGGVIGWFVTLQVKLLSLPARFMQAGADMINGLVLGITSRYEAVKGAILGVVMEIKRTFTSALGIKSPSRVFMGFGENIGAGTRIGILAGLPGVRGAVGKLAGVALAATLGPAMPSLAAGSPTAHGAVAAPAGITVTFSPTINLNGAGADAGAQVNDAMQLSLRDLEQLMRRLQSEQSRRVY